MTSTSSPPQRASDPATPAKRDRAWRTCLVVLAGAGLLLLAIGLGDMLRAEGIEARGTGAVLTVVAGLALFDIKRAWPGAEPRHWTSGVVGASCLLAVSGWWCAAAFPFGQPRLVLVGVVVGAVAAISGVTLLLGWRQRRAGRQDDTGTRERSWRRGEVITAMSTVLAALIALPLAWYSAYYIPTNTVPSVSVKAELGEMTAHDGRGTTTARITVSNTSSAAVRLIGSMYVVSGVTVGSNGQLSDQLDEPKLEAATAHNYGPSARYNATTDLSTPTLIQFGQVAWDQATLVPGESTEMVVVVFFPPKRFDLLRLAVDMVIARDDRLPTNRVNPTVDTSMARATTYCRGHRTIVQTWPLPNRGVVEALTQEDREVVLGRVIHDPAPLPSTWWPPVPYLKYQVQSGEHSCAHLFDENGGGLEASSMVDLTGTVTERLVPRTWARSGTDRYRPRAITRECV